MMKAGLLDRRLTIRRRVQTGVDAMRQPIFAVQDVRTVWAAKVPKSEDEQFDEGTQQRLSSRIVTFRTRHMGSILDTDTLFSEGTSYDVKGIRELGRREGLEITAEAQT